MIPLDQQLVPMSSRYPVSQVSGQLVPSQQGYLVPEQLEQLPAPVPLDRNQLVYLEKETRIKAITAVALQQNSVAADWLRFRQPYERNIRIETVAESRERRWLFARGERLRVTTTINIW